MEKFMISEKTATLELNVPSVGYCSRICAKPGYPCRQFIDHSNTPEDKGWGGRSYQVADTRYSK
jgi:hypothetical protein